MKVRCPFCGVNSYELGIFVAGSIYCEKCGKVYGLDGK